MKHISSTIILMSLALWACSCEDSDTKLPLKAEFESDKTSVLVGDEVSFNDLSTGEPTRWNWTFEGAETEYKYLKAVIEGDLEVRPDNVLIYATSNRRHLLRETFSDRQEIDEDDVHRGDTMAERLSLASRFGVTIGYYKPERQQYFDIVRQLAERSGLTDLTEDQLVKEADLWARNHGGLSGRTARQYIDTLLGQRNDEKE